MKLPLFLCAIAFVMNASNGFANDSIPSAHRNAMEVPQSYRPVFRITERDFAHRPFTNIMEIVNGMFPFVFGDPPHTSEYNFIVDGTLLFNPNAINVSQIAAIEFYPVGFNLGNGSLSGKGTFLIYTKTGSGNNGFSLRSQTGMNFPTNISFREPNIGYAKPDQRELFTYQDIGYTRNTNEVQVSSAFSYTRNAYPGYQSEGGTRKLLYDHAYNRIRFSNFLGFRVSDKLKFTTSFSLNRHTNAYDVESVVEPEVATLIDVGANTFYGVGTIGVEYRFNPSVINTLQVEYAASKRDYEIDDYNYRQAPNDDTYTEYDWTAKRREIAVTNSTKGKISGQQDLEISWELLLRYYSSRLNDASFYMQGVINGTPAHVASGSLVRKHRSLAVMPRLAALFNKQLLVTAGLTFDSQNSVTAQDGESDNNLYPYAGVRWSMPSANGAFSSLHIHSTYSGTLLRGTPSDQVDFNPPASGYYPFAGYFPTPSPKTGYGWISGIDAGFAKERLLVSLSYFLGKGHPMIILPAGGWINYRYEEVKRSGLSASAQAIVANKEKFKCNLRAILFYERNELQNKDLLAGPIPSVRWENPFLNEDISPEWHGSFQADVSSGRLFFQAVALLRPSDGRFPNTGYKRENIQNSGLTFLSAGCRFPSVRKHFSNLELSIQTRNLVLMKAPIAGYYTERYVGVGVNANF